MTRLRKNTILLSSIIAIIVIVALFMLLRGREMRKTTANQPNKIIALICTTSDAKNGFFSMKSAKEVQHIIKVSYEDGRARDINYSMNAFYGTEENAQMAYAGIMADYNTGMAERGLNSENLHPSFSVVGTTFRLNLFASITSALNTIPELFFVEKVNAHVLEHDGWSVIQAYYEEKGFNCSTNDNNS